MNVNKHFQFCVETKDITLVMVDTLYSRTRLRTAKVLQ